MVITVIAMRMMQVAIHEEIRVIPVWDGLMTAAGAVPVLGRVAIAEAGRAVGGVRPADADRVILNPASLRMLEATVRQIVGVSVVLHGAMAARGTVNMLLGR